MTTRSEIMIAILSRGAAYLLPINDHGLQPHLSKLGLRKSFRGASRAAETAICG